MKKILIMIKKSKSIPLFFVISLILFSCVEDKNFETNSVKEIRMNYVGNNYDKLALEIQSIPDLDIVIGDFKLEMRGMKPAKGISVEETIILEDDKNNRTIIIDNNTESIYVRYTDIDEKYDYTLYGFKKSAHLEKMLKLENYNIDTLINSEQYQNRLNKSTKLAFTSSETSFLIRKPILTTKEEILHEKRYDKVLCEVDEKGGGEDYNFLQSVPKSKEWNLVIYKRYNWINTSSILDALKSTFKSLSSEDGSSWFYSTMMYTNLNVSYEIAPAYIYNRNILTCLEKFGLYLINNYIPMNRLTHSYIYLVDHTFPFNSTTHGIVNGVATSDYRIGGYRICVTRNMPDTMAHEVGHTLGSTHYDETVWDSSLGWFGWWGESIMHSTNGGISWYADQQWKYYSIENRNRVRSVLDN